MNIASIFPKALSPFVENGGRCFGAWTEKQQIAAAALVVPPIQGSEELCLLDLCVESAFREQGLAHALLQNLSATLVTEGRQMLRVRCMGTRNQMTETYDLLVTAGFIPCLLTGRLLSWQMMDWLDSPLAEQMKQAPIPAENICDGNALPEEMRAALSVRAGQFDPKLSRFYIIGEKLAGAVYVKRVDEEHVIAYRTYLAKDVPFRKVYVPLFASLYQELRRILPTDAAVSIVSDGSESEHALRKLFDEPDSEAFVQEYVCRFTGQEQKVKFQTGGEEDSKTPLSFGWMTEESESAQMRGDENFSDVQALYAQDEQEQERYLQQQEFLLPCRKVTDEPSLREELNEWLTLLRRDPLPPQKELPFAAFQEQLQAVAMPDEGNGENMCIEKAQETAPVSADQLIYFVFPPDSTMPDRVLPEFLLRGQKEHIILGAKDENGTLHAYASFHRQPFPQRTLMLEYLYVNEQQRGRGIARQLIRFAKDVFSQAGMRGMTTKQAGEEEKLLQGHEFLKHLGFVPITLSARTVLYYLQDLAESRLMEMSPEQRRQLPKIEQIDKRDDFRVVEFTKECRKHGFVFERSRYDTEFTRFYLEGQKICGVIAMEQPTSNLLMMLETYIAPDCQARYIQPALLLSVLDGARQRMREDAMLVLQLYDGWNLQALENLLGEGEQSLRLCEYVMPFR